MLQKVFYLFIFVTFLYSENDLDKNYHFGFSIDRLDSVHQNKIKSVSYRLEKEFEELFNNEYNITVSFVKNEKELIEDFINYRKYNIVIIYASLYLKEKEKLKNISENIFSFNYNKRFQEFIFISNKNSKIDSIKDIKGKKYGNFKGSENCSLWLDYLSLKNLGLEYKGLISYEKEYSKDQRLILDMFFDKLDFGVVRKSVFDDMLLLNPAIKSKIKIVKKSDAIFPYGLGFFHKDTPKELIDKFNKFSDDGVFNKKFKHLFLLLNQTDFGRVSLESLEKFESFHTEYKKLKSKL